MYIVVHVSDVTATGVYKCVCHDGIHTPVAVTYCRVYIYV